MNPHSKASTTPPQKTIVLQNISHREFFRRAARRYGMKNASRFTVLVIAAIANGELDVPPNLLLREIPKPKKDAR